MNVGPHFSLWWLILSKNWNSTRTENVCVCKQTCYHPLHGLLAIGGKCMKTRKNLFNNGSASIGGAWSICFIDNGTMCWCVGATKKRAHHQQFPLVKASNFWSPKRLLCNGRRDLGFLKFDSCPLARCPNIQNGSFAVTVHGRKTNIFLWARFSFAFCLSMSCWLAREISRR